MPNFVEVILTARDMMSDTVDRAADRVERRLGNIDDSSRRTGTGMDDLGKKFSSTSREMDKTSDSSDGFGRAMLLAASKADRLTSSQERLLRGNSSLRDSFTRLRTTIRQTDTDIDRHDSTIRKATSGHDVFARAMGGVLAKIGMMVVALPALAVAVSGVAGAVTALTGGTMALVGALSTLSGVLVALPAGFVMLGGAIASVMAILGSSLGRISQGYKALGQTQKGAAKGAADSAKKIGESEQNLAKVRRDAVERVKEAEKDLLRTRRDTTEAYADAVKTYRDAVKSAMQDVRDAVADLQKTREDAASKELESERQLHEAKMAAIERENEAVSRLQEGDAARLEKWEDFVRKQERAERDRIERELSGVERVDKAREDALDREENARRKVDDARVSAAQRILQTEQKLADLRKSLEDRRRELERASFNADRQAGAASGTAAGATAAAAATEARARLADFTASGTQQVADAEQSAAAEIAKAVVSVQDAEKALSDTREKNVQAVGDAERALADIRAKDAEARDDADRDTFRLQRDMARDRQRDVEGLSKAQRDGIEDVAKAELRLRDTRSDNERRVADAVLAVRSTRIKATQDIEDAEARFFKTRRDLQERLADAEKNFAKLRRDQLDAVNDAARRAASGAAGAGATGVGAVGALQQALAQLSPLELEIATRLKDIVDRFRELTTAARNSALELLRDILIQISADLPAIASKMSTFVTQLVGVGRHALVLSQDPFLRGQMNNVMDGSAKQLGLIGRAVVDLAAALVSVMGAAQPFLNWMAKAIANWAQWVRTVAAVNAQNGQTQAFFGRTKVVLSTVVNILRDLFMALKNVGSIGFPFGLSILKSWEDLAKRARQYTDSVKGKNAIKKFFEDSIPVAKAMGNLLNGLVGVFARLGRQNIAGGKNSGIYGFIDMLKTEFLPWLEEFIRKATKEVGPPLMKMLKEVSKALDSLTGSNSPMVTAINILSTLIGWFNALPGPIKTAIGVIMGVGTAFGVLSTVLSPLIGLVGALGTAIGFLAPILGMSSLALGLWIVAIIAVIAVVVLLVKHWDDVKAALIALWDKIVQAAKAFWDWLSSICSTVGTAIKDFLTGLWDEVKSIADRSWTALKNVITTAWNGIKNFFTSTLFSAFSAPFTALWDTIKNAATSGWNAIKSVVSSGWNAITGFFSDGVLRGLSDLIEKPWQWITTAARALWGTGVGALGVLGDAITGGWNRIKNFFTDGVLSAFSNIFSGLWDTVTGGVRAAWGTGTAALGAIGGGVSKGWGFVKGFFSGDQLTAIPDKIADVWDSVNTGVASGWQKVVSTLQGWLNSFIAGINWILEKIGVPEIPNWGGSAPSGGSGGNPGPPNKYLRTKNAADGGIFHSVPGGLIRVVEDGQPEAIIPLDPRRRKRAWSLLKTVYDKFELEGFKDGAVVWPESRKGGGSLGAFLKTETWVKEQLGKPYLWGAGHSFGTHPKYDCSGFATNAAIRAGYTGGIGDTYSTYRSSSALTGNEPFQFGFSSFGAKGKEGPGHMGISLFGNTYHFGNPGKQDVRSRFSEYKVPIGLAFGQLDPMLRGSQRQGGGFLSGLRSLASGFFKAPIDYVKSKLPSVPDWPGAAVAWKVLRDSAKHLFTSTVSWAVAGLKKTFGGINPFAAGGIVGKDEDLTKTGWGGIRWGSSAPVIGSSQTSLPGDRALDLPQAIGVIMAALRFMSIDDPAQTNRFLTMAHAASGFRSGAISRHGTSISSSGVGFMGLTTSEFRRYAMPGLTNIGDPFHNSVAAMRMAFDREGRDLSKTGAGYAMGGPVSHKAYPPGTPIGATVHVGEWVLNGGQQDRLARLFGSKRAAQTFLFDSAPALGALVGRSAMTRSSNSSRVVNNEVHLHTTQAEVDAGYVAALLDMKARHSA